MGDGPMRAPTSILPLRLHEVSFVAGGRTIVDRISLEIEAGPRTIILGPNGAGKSVLMRLCHGLLDASSGRIEWAAPERPGERRRQAMVFQRPVMLRRSALANVEYALGLAGLNGAERGRQAHAALESVGLADLAERSARVLSGGEQQRLALARAWALRPEVLFLDEPTASLDPAATQAVEVLLEHIHHTGTKIIMTTHDLGQARRLADEVLFLHHGRLVEYAPASAFFGNPQSQEAAAFLEGKLLW